MKPVNAFLVSIFILVLLPAIPASAAEVINFKATASYFDWDICESSNGNLYACKVKMYFETNIMDGEMVLTMGPDFNWIVRGHGGIYHWQGIRTLHFGNGNTLTVIANGVWQLNAQPLHNLDPGAFNWGSDTGPMDICSGTGEFEGATGSISTNIRFTRTDTLLGWDIPEGKFNGTILIGGPPPSNECQEYLP